MTLYKCMPPTGGSHGHAQSQKVKGKKRGKATQRTVDIHCHVHVPEVEDLVRNTPQKQAEAGFRIAMWGEETNRINEQMIGDLMPKLTDVNTRLADMDEMGIDIQAITPSPGQYYYWAETELAKEIVDTQNRRMAEICEQHPDRFVGLGNLALQHTELACEQMSFGMKELGLRGFQISTFVGEDDMDAERFEPVWRRAEELGAVIFIHPLGTTLGARTRKYYLSNIIGQPLETTIALSHMIFGGVLDRYPGLRICAAHGGGYLPHYCGRTEHGYEVRPECTHIRMPPKEYLRRIWFDSLVFEPDGLAHLVEVVGAEQVVIGTDYPFDMGHYDPLDVIDAVKGLTAKQRRAIKGDTAATLLSL